MFLTTNDVISILESSSWHFKKDQSEIAWKQKMATEQAKTGRCIILTVEN